MKILVLAKRIMQDDQRFKDIGLIGQSEHDMSELNSLMLRLINKGFSIEVQNRSPKYIALWVSED